MSGKVYQADPKEIDAAHQKKKFFGGAGCTKPSTN